MKTKTLVLAAAALTACVLTASAQSNVYSLNIVGYVNVTIAPGYNLVANPLDDGNGNSLTNLVPAGLQPGAQVLTYDPVLTYTTFTKKPAGNWSANAPITPGHGYFVRNTNTVVSYTNTYVGNVAGAVPGSITNIIAPGYNLVGSPYPIGGGLTNTGSNTLNIGGVLNPGDQLLTYDPVLTYTTFTKKPTGAWSATTTINVGQGFFARNTNATPVTWIQNVGP